MFWKKNRSSDNELDDSSKINSLMDKINPYFQKALYSVAVMVTDDNFNEEEIIRFVYEKTIRFIPGPISIFIPDKMVLDFLYSRKDKIMSELELYKAKVAEEMKSNEGLKTLEHIESDEGIKMLEHNSET